ncbi:MAG: FtsW/RodA/SpoVE family cell cycle protein [Tenericutes bacterium]|nr:FtsW/RodA/SpoVE family cell cycle protein [Mycoplasmatota bacterium]
MIKAKKFKINYSILICLLIFMVISIISIYSAMTYMPNYLGNLAIKQFIWYILGFILVLAIIKISNKALYQYSWYIYMTNILLLFILLLIGQPINGSKCWFNIPGIGSIQPSEFMKIGIMLTASNITANWIKNSKDKINLKNELSLLLKISIIFIIPTILTFLEPDTGAVFIYFIIILSILWVSPIRKRWFIIGIITFSILLGIFLGIYFYKQELFVKIMGTDLFYRIDRLLDWKNGTGMQLENSLTAIGSSKLLGHGFNRTPIYFPESATDFIFAVYSSNFGLVGGIFLLLLIMYFDLELIRTMKNINNITDKFMLAGIIGMLSYQQFQNIGMTLGILPITGITLPFISYGGSSLISYMIIIGIIFNIYSDNHKTIN